MFTHSLLIVMLPKVRHNLLHDGASSDLARQRLPYLTHECVGSAFERFQNIRLALLR